ncbi:MAG: hypothetical protein OXT67_00465 [Zetaproteobacteria bacterium]|nr:hypothetical protein [Zetaproteobacteria bacterium]
MRLTGIKRFFLCLCIFLSNFAFADFKFPISVKFREQLSSCLKQEGLDDLSYEIALQFDDNLDQGKSNPNFMQQVITSMRQNHGLSVAQTRALQRAISKTIQKPITLAE